LKKAVIVMIFAVLAASAGTAAEDPWTVGQTFHLSFDTEADVLADFLSAAHLFRSARPGQILPNPLDARNMEIVPGRFGNALRIKDGWSKTKGTSNESGADLDLIVATIWGDWRNKPHYWGQGRFRGDRGTVAFWIKADTLVADPLYPLFIQSSIHWGRAERDLLRIDGDAEGRLSVAIRDIFYQYHEVKSETPLWRSGEWQHIAVVYDHAYGLKLYHNGRLAASNWGRDAWWKTPLPGLFSPFHPESSYDEIFLFERTLSDAEIQGLYETNRIPETPEPRAAPDEEARQRRLAAYGPVDSLEMPVLRAGAGALSLRQTRIADCSDEKIPAWWVMDGRYELAWPHPYLSFTFILGDADFHGTKVDISFEDGETANFISMEGILDGIEVHPGKSEPGKNDARMVDLNGYKPFFYSQKLNLEKTRSLHLPMLKGTGTPPGLIDRGTLNFPLAGNIRLHEIQLWNVTELENPDPVDISWKLPFQNRPRGFDIRYLDALFKLMGPYDRTILVGTAVERPSDAPTVDLEALQSLHLFSPDLNPDLAVDRVRLTLSTIPDAPSDVMWINLRDPSNPHRLWARAVIRVQFDEPGKPHKIELEIDPVDLMLAAEDRLWIEVKFAGRQKILTRTDQSPEIGVVLSRDRDRSLAEYSRHVMIPARMQYIKEYNYQPWHFTGEQRNLSGIAFNGGAIPSNFSFVSGQTQGLNFWSNFAGPYDMWYPPDAVLRHNPDDEIARTYKAITGERAQTYGGYNIRSFTPVEQVSLSPDIPSATPDWAVWMREMYINQLRTIHWIVGMQRQDGMFWGGSNDDIFIPLGYSAIPLMGDTVSRDSFLRMYDGLEALGVFKDGYCDIWPIDYLHITDFLASRGLMVPYALGDPHVLEREMITARVYRDIMEKNNAERAEHGLPPYERGDDSFQKEPKLWGESLVRDYEATQVKWYWGETPEAEPHILADRKDIARRMMTTAIRYDNIEEFEWTRALRHTDRQAGAPGRNELISAALGGRIQGRIEPHPHSMVVSWNNPDPDISRLVSYGDSRTVRVNLFNFKSDPQSISMRLWRIEDGIYRLRMGLDLDDDGKIDSRRPLLRDEKIALRRFSDTSLVIPPLQNVAVEIERVKALKSHGSLPDLAVHPERGVNAIGDELRVTVHNIGNAPARNVVVDILDASGRLIGRETIRDIEAPLDWKPRTIELRFDLQGRDWAKIVIDPENKIREIYKGNNTVAVKNGLQAR
jgi:hypothetical protein